jgi:hypothetical protein
MKRHRDDEGIEQRIRRDLAFLFEEYGGVVTSSSRQPAGISEVLVAAGNLEFQFSRNTRDGENLVKVGPRDGLGIWELLPVALAASTGENPRTLNYPISFEDDTESSVLHWIDPAGVGFEASIRTLEPGLCGRALRNNPPHHGSY